MQELQVGQVVKVQANAEVLSNWSIHHLSGKIFKVETLRGNDHHGHQCAIGPEGFFVPPEACELVYEADDDYLYVVKSKDVDAYLSVFGHSHADTFSSFDAAEAAMKRWGGEGLEVKRWKIVEEAC